MRDISPQTELVLHPIGVVHSPFHERLQAPRQPAAAAGIEGSIELFPTNGVEHALEDLASFRFIWVLFWFHKNQSFKPKVLPPRSQQRRGVFATRSPYRPNPIGLSALELLAVEGRVLRVRNLDILDGTPVLDVKPYIPYTDSIGLANSGWLEQPDSSNDPLPAYLVTFSEGAVARLAYLEQEHELVLREHVEQVLRLGPQPHPYRRIKRQGDGFVLAYKAWRFSFTADASRIRVTDVRSGYNPSELFDKGDPELAVHREFQERFGVRNVTG